MLSSVLQPWLEQVPWKQQSILFSGLRGPDHAPCPHVKLVSRWLRRISQKNADPSKPYMEGDGSLNLTALLPGLDNELEHCHVHFVHHFADSIRVVSIHHPDEGVRMDAWAVYYHIAEELFHWNPESNAIFLRRHRDVVEHG